jgi:sarcosine oxidase, subunit delta
MLLIKCPVCGCEGDETDFHYGGEGHIHRPASSHPGKVGDDAQRDYLYVRKNPRGNHAERWLCERGCGKWFHALRDTLSLVISDTYLITEQSPAANKEGES